MSETELPVSDEFLEFNEDGTDIDEVVIDMGNAPDTFNPAAFDANLAFTLSTAELETIGSERQQILSNLRTTREQWEERLRLAVRWLGLSTESEGNLPTEDSCKAVHPLLIENVVKFQAKAIQELWPAKGPVRTKIKGYVDAEREAAAARVRTHMNYQLTEQVPSFYSDLEQNLFRVGFMGTGIRKVSWSSDFGGPDPTVVAAENFFVDNTVSHLRYAEEYVELMDVSPRTHQIRVAGGLWLDCGDQAQQLVPDELTEAINTAQGFEANMDRRGYRVGESYCYLDLEGSDPLLPNGGSAPYIVHFNVDTGKVYSVRRNWREQDPARIKRIWHTVDILIRGFGFYGLGFAHLVGDLAAASTATLRALVDAGMFANWQGGFKTKDAKFIGSDEPLGFGEWRDVNFTGNKLEDAFLPLPAKEPSQTLFALLQFMVASGQKFADAADEVVAGATNYGPAATTLALLEASGRFYSSIHKRLHQSQHEFFKLIGELNFENLPDAINFVVNDENQTVSRLDYNPEIVDVLPASDPNALSESQRVARAQIEVEMAARFPQLHDLREALRRFYSAMGTDAIGKLLPEPGTNALTADPLSELQAAMTGKPIKAQMGQDHQAHIAVKEAFMKAPQMQGTNDPTIAIGLELIKANIAEHKTLMFVSQIMQMAQETGLPVENEQVQALLANQLVALSAAQSGNPENIPIEQQMIQINREELEVARQRLASQDARENAKLAVKQQELELRRLKLLSDIAAKNADRELEAANKVLDLATKEADTARQPLATRTMNPLA